MPMQMPQGVWKIFFLVGEGGVFEILIAMCDYLFLDVDRIFVCISDKEMICDLNYSLVMIGAIVLRMLFKFEYMLTIILLICPLKKNNTYDIKESTRIAMKFEHALHMTIVDTNSFTIKNPYLFFQVMNLD